MHDKQFLNNGIMEHVTVSKSQLRTPLNSCFRCCNSTHQRYMHDKQFSNNGIMEQVTVSKS